MITFFVLLLSMSSMDETAFSDVFGEELASSQDIIRPEPPMGRSPLPAIQPSNGSWVGNPSALPVDPEPGHHGRHKTAEQGVNQKAAKALRPDPRGVDHDERLKAAFEKVQDLLNIESVNEEEIRVTVNDAIFFKNEEFNPTPEAREIIRAIADLTKEYGGQLEIRAHRGRWEVAAKRSAAVARYLVRTGVPGEKLNADVIVGEEGMLNFAIKRSTPLEKATQVKGAQ
jgi:flagellar motor protein MotB